MGKEILTFGNTEIEKKKTNKNKQKQNKTKQKSQNVFKKI